MKFTERARGFLQAAQTIAIREFHQQITPQHLLKALLDDEGRRSRRPDQGPQAATRKAALAAVGTELERLPKVARLRVPASRTGSRLTSCASWMSRGMSRPRPRPATSSSLQDRLSRWWQSLRLPDTPAARALLQRAARLPAGVGEARSTTSARVPHAGRQPECRVELRRVEEIRPRHNSVGAREGKL